MLDQIRRQAITKIREPETAETTTIASIIVVQYPEEKNNYKTCPQKETQQTFYSKGKMLTSHLNSTKLNASDISFDLEVENQGRVQMNE